MNKLNTLTKMDQETLNKLISGRERLLLNNVDCSGLDFSNAHLRGSEFNLCDMTGCNFRHSNLSQSKFNRCDLSRSDFNTSNVSRSTFYECDMIKVNMYYANINEADFGTSMVNNDYIHGVIGNTYNISSFSIAGVHVVLSNSYIYINKHKFKYAELDTNDLIQIGLDIDWIDRYIKTLIDVVYVLSPKLNIEVRKQVA